MEGPIVFAVIRNAADRTSVIPSGSRCRIIDIEDCEVIESSVIEDMSVIEDILKGDTDPTVFTELFTFLLRFCVKDGGIAVIVVTTVATGDEEADEDDEDGGSAYIGVQEDEVPPV